MHKCSWRSLKRSLPNYRHWGTLERFLGRVIAAEKPLAVILFGSLAQGSALPDSDADLVVIYDSPVNLLDKGATLRLMSGDGWVEPFAYGVSQLQRMLGDANPFMLDIFADGVILYERRPDVLDSLEALYRQVVRTFRLQRLADGWRARRLVA